MVLLAAAGCSGAAEPAPAPALATETQAPAYDPEANPATAALALVPREARDLALTDLEHIRLDLEASELTGSSPKALRDRFWLRAERSAPLLGDPLLRGIDAELSQRFGWTMDDVDWQVLFGGPEGTGWVLKIRDDLPMGDVTRAVEAGVGPLAGAVVRAENHLVMKNGTDDARLSWAAEPDLAALVGPAAAAVYASRTCLRLNAVFPDVDLAPGPTADLADLADLGPFSVIIGTKLAAARLGQGRADVFARLRAADALPATDPEFAGVFVRGSADPLGGRLGWTVTDAAAAADLTLARQLPFALCAR